MTPIDALGDGEIFGEIGVLTNLGRTASIKTETVCQFWTLEQHHVERIKQEFPSMFRKLYANMQNYEDEDMYQRR
jgi:CRP-like cAMP-binding protein